MDEQPDFDMPSELDWARQGARMVLRQEERAAISTANYVECGFILAAARVCLQDEAFAAAVGALMEPARAAEHVTG